MAGKCRGASRGVELGNVTGISGVTDTWNVPGKKARLVRAYAEGRANGTNTHATNSEAWKVHAWGVNNRGSSSYSYETAVP